LIVLENLVNHFNFINMKKIIIIVGLFLLVLNSSYAQRNWRNVQLKDNGNAWCTMLADNDIWWDSGRGNFTFSHCSSICTGDFDGNGYTDVACFYYYGSDSDVAVWAWLSNGHKFDFKRWWPVQKNEITFSRISNIRTGDYNKDGKYDIKFSYNYNSVNKDLIMYSNGSGFNKWVPAN